MSETQLTWPNSCFCVYKPFDGHEITQLKFMNPYSQKIALATSNNLVRNLSLTLRLYHKTPFTYIQVFKL